MNLWKKVREVENAAKEVQQKLSHTKSRSDNSEADNDDFQFQYDNPLTNFSLPHWMEEFFENQPIPTHNDTLADQNEKFLVMTCHVFKGGAQLEACGGLSDRMMLFPYYIWLAHKTGRKFLIKYSKPHPLEEFLVPPEGGLDWRLPDEYCEEEWKAYANRSFAEFRNQRRMVWHHHINKPPYNTTRFIFANTNLASRAIGDTFLVETGLRTEDIWPGVFRRMFKPSKAVGELIETLARESGLVPGEYAGAHIRARFPVGSEKIKMIRGKELVNMNDNITKTYVHQIGDNAANCALKAMPETKHIFIATDTSELIDYLLYESPIWGDHARKKNNNITTSVTKLHHYPLAKIVTRSDYNVSSLHLDKADKAPPKAFYQIFVDLWILSHTKCISQGYGGFGHFCSMLSGNHHTCRVRHREYNLGILESCPSPMELKLMKLRQENIKLKKENEKVVEDLKSFQNKLKSKVV